MQWARWAEGCTTWRQDRNFETFFVEHLILIRELLESNHYFSIGLHKVETSILNYFKRLKTSLSGKNKIKTLSEVANPEPSPS